MAYSTSLTLNKQQAKTMLEAVRFTLAEAPEGECNPLALHVAERMLVHAVCRIQDTEKRAEARRPRYSTHVDVMEKDEA